MPYFPSLSIQSILSSIRVAACRSIDKAVNISFSAAENDTQGKAGEIERLVYFFTDGVSDLQVQLNSLLSPFQLRITLNTIFCHQSPTVDALPLFGSRKGSELADLAILVRYGNGIAPLPHGLGNAVLLQAKADFFPGCSPAQEYLFERASAFSYRAPALMRSRGYRSLKKADDCLWYWDFMTRNRGQASWNTQTYTRRGHSNSLLFSELVIGLLEGNIGRGVRKTLSGSSGWSAIIHDLLDVTADRLYRRKIVNSSKIASGRRGRFCLATMNSAIDAGGDPPVFFYHGGSPGWEIFPEELRLFIARNSEDTSLPPNETIPPKNVDQISRDRGDNPEGGFPNFLLVSLDRNSEAEEEDGRSR